MMADVRVCRLCKKVLRTKKSVALFSATGREDPSPPGSPPADPFPSHICDGCKAKLVHLEKAAVQLARFKDLARSSLETRGLKRTKERLVCHLTLLELDLIPS